MSNSEMCSTIQFAFDTATSVGASTLEEAMLAFVETVANEAASIQDFDCTGAEAAIAKLISIYPLASASEEEKAAAGLAARAQI